jgi:y4mF family transcriptional regulator
LNKLTIKNSKDVGAALRARRKQLGLTQQELVEIAPFGTTFFSDLENGKETAHLNKAIEAIRILGLRLVIEIPDN